MPKRKRPEEKPKDQFKKFVETAKELGVEEGEAVVETAFTRLAASVKRPSAPKARK